MYTPTPLHIYTPFYPNTISPSNPNSFHCLSLSLFILATSCDQPHPTSKGCSVTDVYDRRNVHLAEAAARDAVTIVCKTTAAHDCRAHR